MLSTRSGNLMYLSWALRKISPLTIFFSPAIGDAYEVSRTSKVCLHLSCSARITLLTLCLFTGGEKLWFGNFNCGFLTLKEMVELSSKADSINVSIFGKEGNTMKRRTGQTIDAPVGPKLLHRLLRRTTSSLAPPAHSPLPRPPSHVSSVVLVARFTLVILSPST